MNKPADDQKLTKEHGEGNYKASRQYNDATKKFVESGRVDEAARNAAPKSEKKSKTPALDHFCRDLCDHLAVAGRAGVAQRQPHLQRPEATGVLRAEVDVVGRLLAKVVIRRVVCESVSKALRIANEDAAGLKGSVQPFMRIDCDRVGDGVNADPIDGEGPDANQARRKRSRRA